MSECKECQHYTNETYISGQYRRVYFYKVCKVCRNHKARENYWLKQGYRLDDDGHPERM